MPKGYSPDAGNGLGAEHEAESADRDRKLLADIRSCTVCAAELPLGPRPVVQFSSQARILIIGQAPGTRVHETGIPWNDSSGDRLRQWTGLSIDEFYDARKVASMPMGFCYPGRRKGGDLPPRSECGPLWHDKILAQLPARRLTLLVGLYAQAAYLPQPQSSLTQNVREFQRYGPLLCPLPHPSWRSAGWSKRNLWFEAEVLPELKKWVRASLD
jgi:uracil-DNA glycosylase